MTVERVYDSPDFPGGRVWATYGIDTIKGEPILLSPLPQLSQGDLDKLGRSPNEEYNWNDDALCSQIDTDAFHPKKGGSMVFAKEVCRLCGVQEECLADALQDPDRRGIWAGTSQNDRLKILKRKLAG
ncbi:MAG TPA: WhiB family transcriptional regulator [Candidatus Saccharimonadales bacterium]